MRTRQKKDVDWSIIDGLPLAVEHIPSTLEALHKLPHGDRRAHKA